jgi:Domain of unknown function (DUF6883)
MKLPNGERAVVEIRKLQDYCLSKTHPSGRNKARVFASALGLTVEHAEQLRRALLDAARTLDGAEPGENDDYGRRFGLDLPVTGPAGTARVRSGWIVLKTEDFPRLVTCYVL